MIFLKNNSVNDVGDKDMFFFVKREIICKFGLCLLVTSLAFDT